MTYAGRALLFDSAQQSLKAIQSLPSYEHMVLQPFTTAEVQQYMRVALDKERITDQTAAAVHERTGGLPLYVEQVCLPQALALQFTGFALCTEALALDLLTDTEQQ